MHTMPLSLTTLAHDKALSRLKSIGFSQKTGLPARAHRSIRSACVAVLLAMIKASISLLLNAWSKLKTMALYFLASCSAVLDGGQQQNEA